MTEQPRPLVEALTLAAEVRDYVDNTGAGSDLASLDAATEQADGAPVTVAVVGETNRGKSSLLNTLLDEPGLLPVDHRAATAGCVLVRHGARRRALLEGRPDRQIAVAEVPRWTTLSGARQRRDEGALDAGPAWVAIETPRRLLADGLQLVDTPGVDGVAGFVAAQELGADAAIVALDAAVPVAPEEIDLLTAVVDGLPAVVAVLTKIDSSAEWEDVRADDAELIERKVSSAAGIGLIGVSSTWQAMAEELRRSGAAVEAQELADRAGFAALTAWVETTLFRLRLMRGRDLLQTCGLLLSETLADGRLRLAAAEAADDTLVQQLRERHKRLTTFATTAAEVRAIAEEERDRLFVRIRQRLAQRRAELERRLARIDRTGVRAQSDLGSELTAMLLETDREMAAYALDYSRTAMMGGVATLARLGYSELVVAYDGDIEQPAAVLGIDPDLNRREVDFATVIERAKVIGAAVGLDAASKMAGAAGRTLATRAAAASPALAAFGALAVVTPVVVGGYVEARREAVRAALADKLTEVRVILDELEEGWQQAVQRAIDELWRALNEEAGRQAERTAEHLSLATAARDHDAARVRAEQRLARQTVQLADHLLRRVQTALADLEAAMDASWC